MTSKETRFKRRQRQTGQICMKCPVCGHSLARGKWSRRGVHCKRCNRFFKLNRLPWWRRILKYLIYIVSIVNPIAWVRYWWLRHKITKSAKRARAQAQKRTEG